MRGKMALLLSTLVIALMVVGTGFALWSKTLYINGTVNTGTVEAGFDNVMCNDNGIDPGYDKDVASCTVEVSQDHQTITVTINNAYPSYSCDIDYDILNKGSIPVKIQSITINAPSEVTVEVTGISVGDQIDPDQLIHGDLHIHVEQTAAQGATYTFTVDILLVQWNEFTPP